MTDSKKITRRDAIKTTSAGLFASGLLTNQSAFAAQDMPMRQLGKTGENVSMLTLGCGHLREQFMTEEEAVAIVHHAMDLGVNFIDTAPNYSESEDFVGTALKGKRDNVFLATKNEEATHEKAWELLQRSLERLQTDHVDLVYIHNFGFEERFPDVDAALGKDGILGALVKARDEGLTKYIGVSGHLYPSRWKAVMARDEIDVVMCAVNYIAKHQYDFEDKVFADANQKNMGQVAMKVIGGPARWNDGKARLSDNLDQAIRYVLTLPGVATANIGVRSINELDEVAAIVKQFSPLNEKEMSALLAQGKEMAQEMDPLYGNPTA